MHQTPHLLNHSVWEWSPSSRVFNKLTDPCRCVAGLGDFGSALLSPETVAWFPRYSPSPCEEEAQERDRGQRVTCRTETLVSSPRGADLAHTAALCFPDQEPSTSPGSESSRRLRVSRTSVPRPPAPAPAKVTQGLQPRALLNQTPFCLLEHVNGGAPKRRGPQGRGVHMPFRSPKGVFARDSVLPLVHPWL